MTGYEVIAEVTTQVPQWMVGIIQSVFFLGLLYTCWMFYTWIGQNARNGHIQKARVCALLLFLNIVAVVVFLLAQLGVI